MCRTYFIKILFYSITVHGALAKEVVSQNPLLEFKISPILKDTFTMVEAINNQLDAAPQHLKMKAKEMYRAIIKMILGTALDEEKVIVQYAEDNNK